MDSALTSQAVNHFIESHHNQLGLVVVSNATSNKRGGSIKQFLHLYRRSGMKFSLFLTYGFFLYPLFIAAGAFFNNLLGRKSRVLPLQDLCRRYNIPYRRCDDINDGQINQVLNEQGIDLIITCFFDQILTAATIKLPRVACLNIHPGVLPACRGVFPEVHTAAGKYPDFGFTIHLIDDPGIDTGRILRIGTVRVNNRNMLEIGRRLLAEGLTALEPILTDIDTYLADARTQGEGTYYSYPVREDIRQLESAGYTLW